MKLSVATNWDLALLDRLGKIPQVSSVYGKKDRDFFGGGRPSYLLPEAGTEQVERYVRETHKRGFRFNYLINPQCLDNLEYTAEFHRLIIEEIQWLDDIGVDAVTVSIPFLLQLIKRQFPRLRVTVSVFANINSVQRAQFFEDLGVDTISLPEYVNRDFRLLEQITRGVSCDVQLIANMTCLFGCPFQLYHANLVSHASQAEHVSRGFCPDYCILNCTKRKISRPEEIIKSRWIRPEDTHVYEEVGIASFKIIERFDSTETLTRTVDAYAARAYDGNLADILNIKTRPQKQLSPDVSYFLQPDLADVSRLKDMEETLYLADQYIDNQALDGFLEFFKTKQCYTSSCDDCGYCGDMALDAVWIDPHAASRALERLDARLEDLVSSRMFETKPQPKEGEMLWGRSVREQFLKVVGRIPVEFRDVAARAVSRRAFALAGERGSTEVEIEDVVRAFLSETPEAFQPALREDLRMIAPDFDYNLK
jgi:collagenase-like PrtC family protease